MGERGGGNRLSVKVCRLTKCCASGRLLANKFVEMLKYFDPQGVKFRCHTPSESLAPPTSATFCYLLRFLSSQTKTPFRTCVICSCRCSVDDMTELFKLLEEKQDDGEGVGYVTKDIVRSFFGKDLG